MYSENIEEEKNDVKDPQQRFLGRRHVITSRGSLRCDTDERPLIADPVAGIESTMVGGIETGFH